MTTGMHIVADIACAKCLNVVGWKYVSTTISLLQNLPYGHIRCAVQLSWRACPLQDCMGSSHQLKCVGHLRLPFHINKCVTSWCERRAHAPGVEVKQQI
jgi:hypothetical protein